MRNNIRAWAARADRGDADWYRVAHAHCQRLAKRYRFPVRIVAAVMATLSPGTSWERNLTETEVMLREARTGVRTETFTTYPANVKKAERILADMPRDERILGYVKPRKESGFKVAAFYRNIADPKDPEPVTVDRHAIGIAIGRVPSANEQRLTGKRYAAIAEVYREVARELNMLPSELQAMTWCAYRRVNGDLHRQALPFGGI